MHKRYIRRMGLKRITPIGNPRKTALIIMACGTLMVVLDLFVFGGIDYIIQKPTPEGKAVLLAREQSKQVQEEIEKTVEEIWLGTEEELANSFIVPSDPEELSPVDEMGTTDIKAWQKYAAAFEPASGAQGKVVIIIDDLGLDRKRSAAVVDLPSPLTLAYLPYAGALKKQTSDARAHGHELLIHTPMEPVSHTQNPGPDALLDAMSPEEIKVAFSSILQSFEGYIGINNHMGSLLTQNSESMHMIMSMLKERGLVFVDSKTSAKSVAADVAKETGIYYGQRDVFLDHKDTEEFVSQALEKLERIAKKKGVAVAIGHPKDHTIAALKAWIPTLKDKGLELAPVSAVLIAPPPAQPRG